MVTTQGLENAIKRQPNMWITVRDRESGALLEAWDRDTGRLYIKITGGWGWID